jgi:ATP-binding cassette, subfamily B, bacterial PglK
MKRLHIFLKECIYLLGDDTRKLPKILALFFFSSILDLIGLGLIGPFAALVFSNSDDQLDSLNNISPHLFELVISINRITGPNVSTLLLFTALILLVFLLKMVAGIAIANITWRFSMLRQAKLRSTLMQSYQSQPYEKHITRNSSDYIYSIETLTKIYSGQVLQPLLQTTSDGLIAIVVITMLFWTNTSITIMLVVISVGTTYFYDRFFKKRLGLFGERSIDSSIKAVRTIQDGIRGFKEFRILGVEEFFYRHLTRYSRDFSKYQKRILVIKAAPRYIVEFIVVLFVLIVVLYFSSVNRTKEMLLPTLAVFFLAAMRLLPVIDRFARTVIGLRAHRTAVTRLYNDCSMIDMLNNNLTDAPPQKDFGSTNNFTLSMDHVSYCYPNAKSATLNDVTLTINSSECIGIVGESGAGKTTLVDLMLGLLTPTAGTATLEGVPITLASRHWNERLAYVPQDSIIIDASLRENILLGHERSDEGDAFIIEILSRLRLKPLLDRLPEGVNTVLGEQGVQLSGGERQRIVLARAFFRHRDFIVLDEPTSALDNTTEREITEQIQALKGSKTMVIVSHRPDTIRYCDRIYEIKNRTVTCI